MMRNRIEPQARQVSARSQHSNSSSFRMLHHFCTPSPPAPPSRKLIIGGLSESVDEQALKDAFSSFGEVEEVNVLYDKERGRSKGLGFVLFLEEHNAVSAKDAMDGKELLGRPLSIRFAVKRVLGGPVVVPRLGNSKRHG